MPKFNLYWSERRSAQIEADTQEEAMLKYEAGDYDSDYVGEHDFRIEEENWEYEQVTGDASLARAIVNGTINLKEDENDA